MSGARPLAPRARLEAWPVLVTYAAALVLVFAATAAFVFGVAWWRSRGLPSAVSERAGAFAMSTPGIVGAALVSAAVLGVLAIVAARASGVDVASALRLGPSRASPLGFAAATAGMAGLSALCGAVSDLAGTRGATMQAVALALQRPTPVAFIAAVGGIAVAPALCEETFFRGLMQTRLAERWGVPRGIAAAAAAFGVIHMDPVQGSVAFFAGLYLGWASDRLGGIRPAIVAHAVNNTIFVTLAAFGPLQDATTRAGNVVTAAAGAMLCAGSIALLRSNRAIGRAPAPAPAANEANDRAACEASER